MRSKIVISLLIIVPACIGCASSLINPVELKLQGTFQFDGLKDRHILELKYHEGTLFAGTFRGLYKKTRKGSWQLLGLEHAKIESFVILSEREYLVSLKIKQDSLTIVKTVNGGGTWAPYLNNYGGEDKISAPRAMDLDPFNPDVIYAGGPGGNEVAKSINEGKSWELISAKIWGWGGGLVFIHVGKHYVWAGGINTVFKPYLMKIDKDNNSKHVIIKRGPEDPVTDIALKFGNNNKILAAVGGVVWKSTNGGDSWNNFVFYKVGTRTLIHSAANPGIVYGSGFNEEETLFFSATADFGKDWEIVQWKNSPAGLHVDDMISVIQDGREVLYFATNKGIYSYHFGN